MNNTSYTFQATPKAMTQTPKYRDQASTTKKNIMYDKRVVRGSTYITHPLQNVDNNIMKTNNIIKQQNNTSIPIRSRTPEPVNGRKHIDIQTDNYLEELTDKPYEENISTQTDTYLDKPSIPIFIPTSSGEDKETQVYDGELFEFNIEVEPILEVLVGKAIDQSLIEVIEEQEAKAIKAQQESFEQLRAINLAETQRLEAAEKRKAEEANKRKQQELERIQKEKELQEKVAARSVAKDTLSGLAASVFEKLQREGIFEDQIHKDVREQFLPFLKSEVLSNIKQTENSHALVESILSSSMNSIQASTIQGLKSINKESDLNRQELEIVSEPEVSEIVAPISEEDKEEEKSSENVESVAEEQPVAEEPVAVASE